ncbi:MAG: hypothetical protein IPL61_07965 [Myxococcales bacterium]|nr:hypothetical protein [Myxococcales bacterium]
MRSATIVLIAYGLLLVLGVTWSVLPIPVVGDAPPDVAALTAGYLGLTARRGVAGAVGAAVVTGYLADLLSGAPGGLLALTAGLVCVSAIGIQRRILVRGWGLTAGFAFAAAALALIASLLVRIVLGGPVAGARLELWTLARVCLVTALCGPLVIRLYRRVDAAFARTHRERDHALEGLAP